MTTPTNMELIEAAIENTEELIEYVLSESGDPNLPKWLEEIKEKLQIVINRYKGEDN